ncbi:hypothetical protein GGR56DRAFT_560446 [Xylariaceae sp. FL0804]|nr:hypothetical protein GGR56DRAFT_560446 [Xylariaceae sp. FL0804]
MTDRSFAANSGSIRVRRAPGLEPPQPGQPGPGGQGGQRNSSARSSAFYNDDPLPPQGNGLGYASLRSTVSRFSLNEQFATTRRDFDFGFDDAASSVWDRGTVRSSAVDEDASSVWERDAVASRAFEELDMDDTVTMNLDEQELMTSFPTLYEVDFYDLLCVSRDASAQSIQRAYYRLFTLLQPDMQRPHFRHAAEAYFSAVQTAFETLRDPHRRLKYDQDCQATCMDGAGVAEEAHLDEHLDGLPRLARRGVAEPDHDGAPSIWEMGVRFYIQQALAQARHGPIRGRLGLQPLDFGMSNSKSFGLPEVDNRLRRALQTIRTLPATWRAASQTKVSTSSSLEETNEQQPPPSRQPLGTFLTLRGSVYGLLEDAGSVPSAVVQDPRQPSLPAVPSRLRAVQLQNGRVQPLISAKLQHCISWRDAKAQDGGLRGPADQTPDAVVELETGALPEPAACVRLVKRITLPYDKHATLAQIAARTSLWDTTYPSINSCLQRPLAFGQFFCAVDSGDWSLQPRNTCRFFADFSRVHGRMHNLNLPWHSPPRVEVAYRLGGSLRLDEYSAQDHHSTDRGLRGLDLGFAANEQLSWTASAVAEPNYQSASIKCARNIDLSLTQPSHTLDTVSGTGRPTIREIPDNHRVRVEAELSSDTLWAGFLSLRCLRRFGRFSRAGVEVGMSTYSLHFAVYWSRLGQRISLPFFIWPRSDLSTKVFLWGTVMPFAGWTAWKWWSHYRKRDRCQEQLDATPSKQVDATPSKQLDAPHSTHSDSTDSTQSDSLQDRRRAEADQLAAVMYLGVNNRQKAEYLENGLVILSAKYGVKARDSSNAWGVEEVADVTVAVAALVYKGRLDIPAGVHKSRILGFWDPSPSEEKALHVKYTYRGKEATAEVEGDDEELSLPPKSTNA